ncbi:hypothetical protein [Mesorhizobium caraganae]|uniref:hypothetical protein n=1 Tax=Mesorhizobium caraganae TaxID=483206 RepID=UPI0035E43392
MRRLVGYGRFVGAEATAALGQLYAVVRLYGNLFQPSFKLQGKTRIGARVIKRYHPPVPPAARVLTHPGVAEAKKQQLQAMMETADPVLLFAGIRAAQQELGRRVDRRGLNAKIEEPAVIDLQRFAANLKTAWKSGETRPTHRRPYRRTKPYPKKPSMYGPFEAQIKAWLEEDPALSAAIVLQRLTKIDPSRFKEKNLRMVQRLVKAWRMEMAGLIILDGGWMKSWPYLPPPRRREIGAMSAPSRSVTFLGEAAILMREAAIFVRTVAAQFVVAARQALPGVLFPGCGMPPPRCFCDARGEAFDETGDDQADVEAHRGCLDAGADGALRLLGFRLVSGLGISAQAFARARGG